MAPIYDYKAFDTAGKSSRGLIEADSQKTARQKLKKQGLMVTAVTEKNATQGPTTASSQLFGGRVSGADVTMMTRQLASLVKANIPLVEALNALVDQTESPVLRVILAQVRQEVNEGSTLARALAKHPKAFDNIFINMVDAGESSGTMGQVLIRLADLKESQMRLRGKVISGMTYPIIMMVVAVGMVLVIFTLVIPKLAKVFEGSKKPLPAITKVMLQMSGFVVDWWWLMIAAAVGAVFLFLKYIKTESGRENWDVFKLKAPIFGPLIRIIAVTRFASTMATLLGSGVPILMAMNIAKNLVDNVPISRAIANARENITEGQSIAEPLKRSGQFPSIVIHMIAIGEKTGELPEMMQSVATTYEDQVNARIEGMTALLEPIMIVGMGVVVGVIVFSVFLPIMDMSNIN